MQVSVIGLGYVGCVTAACLARNGHQVIGIDVSPEKVDMVNQGTSPIVEPGLGDLLREVVGAGRLRATTRLEEAVADPDVILICVGTPSGPHGQPSLDALKRVAAEIGTALRASKRDCLVVLRSTVLPGTTEDVLLPALAAHADGAAPRVAFNPEFMREGASLHDFDHPPFVVVGTDDARSVEQMRELYEGVQAPVVRTSLRTAELVKYACNAYHALKVVFANEVADLADALGADAREALHIFALDRKLNISEAYLKPGFAFGGSCLPKDLRAMLWAGRTHDVDLPMLASILPSNDLQVRAAFHRVVELGHRRVGVVGLAFKPGTDDLRESPVVTLVEALIGKGFDVRVLDRNVSVARLMGANRRYIATEIPHIASLLSEDAQALVDHSDVIVVGGRTEDLDEVLALVKPTQIVIDLTRSGQLEKRPRPHAAARVEALA